MHLADLFEEHTERLDITETDVGVAGKTWLFEGRLLKPDWLENSKDIAVELWGTKNGDVFQASQIVAHRQGSGYATELLKHVTKRLKELHLKRIECYVVSSNANSKNMLRKGGFKEERQAKDGSYWALDL